MGYVERMLGNNEKVVFVTHQHWMMLIPGLAADLLLALAIVVLTALVISLNLLSLGLLGLVLMALLVIPVGRFVWNYLVWTNREYIITNRRVIQISGVVNKNDFDSSLEKVNDVKMSQSFFGRMFDYGDVEIMTAAEEGENLFRRIQNPIKFKTAMLNQKEALGSDEGIPAGRHAPPSPMHPVPPGPMDVPKMIEDLDQLRKQGVITEDEFQRKKQDLLSRI